MKDRARSGFALMVVIAVVLGVLIGTRNVGGPLANGARLATGGETQPVAAESAGSASDGSSGPAGAGLAAGDGAHSRTYAGTSVPASTGSAVARDASPTGSSASAQGADTTSDDFFSEYRLERTRTRSKNIELLQQVVADEKASEEARAAASTQLVDLSKKTEAEAEAEALIRARGYEDALVFVRGDTCDVVVSGPELTRSDAEQIGDIVARCLGVELANITIIERGN
ncbi:MAG: SpoIIIAH-like family protein [Betaproteobacteria bacterium]